MIARTLASRLLRQSSALASRRPRSFVELKTRVKDSLARPRPASFVHASIGHAGNLFHLGAYCVQDLLPLRILGLCGSSLNILYNARHPTGPLFLPIAWGLVFVLINGWRLEQLLSSDDITFSRDSLQIYDDIFSHHSFTPRQYKTMLDLAREEHIEPGEVVVEKGVCYDNLLLVLEGDCLATRDDRSTKGNSKLRSHNSRGIEHAVTRGTLIGNIAFAESAPDEQPYTVVAGHEGARLLRWSFADLREEMKKDKLLSLALNRMLRRKLTSEYTHVLQQAAEHQLQTYQWMIECCCIDNIVPPAEKKLLRQFRNENGITEEAHVDCLEAIGWTKEEFLDGGRGHILTTALVDATLKRLSEQGFRLEEKKILVE